MVATRNGSRVLRRELSFSECHDDGDDAARQDYHQKMFTNVNHHHSLRSGSSFRHNSNLYANNESGTRYLFDDWCVKRNGSGSTASAKFQSNNNGINGYSHAATPSDVTATSTSSTNSQQTSKHSAVNNTILYDEESLMRHSSISVSDLVTFLMIFGLFYAAGYYTYECLGSLPTILLISVGVTLFSWIITYFDSMKPGVTPPSPLSSSRYREMSGHTFHLGYTMSIMSGIVTFIVLYMNSEFDLITAPPL